MTVQPDHLAQALMSLSDLNRFDAPQALRHYQSLIATDARFGCLCPFTGHRITPTAHYLLPGAAVFYWCDGPVPFILLASSLKDGFPITTVITASGDYPVTGPQLGPLIQMARGMLHTGPEVLTTHGNQPVLHIGDPNFAHCLWNEFPALKALPDHNARLAVHFDPLSLLKPYATHRGMTLDHITDRAAQKGWQQVPTAHLGSTFCDDAARDAARHICAMPAPQPTNAIWISIRDAGRTAENQVTFLTSAIRAIAQHDPDTTFYLDGFSTPMDIDAPIYDPLRHAFAARINGGQQIANAIITALPQARIINMTGAPLLQSLHRIDTTSFYITHAGTMQHKAAWLSPRAGILHGNHASLSKGALRWNAGMVAGSLPPAGLAPGVVRDTDVRGQPTINDRNRDYIITDIPSAVTDIMDQFVAATTPKPAPMIPVD